MFPTCWNITSHCRADIEKYTVHYSHFTPTLIDQYPKRVPENVVQYIILNLAVPRVMLRMLHTVGTIH